MNKTGKQTIDEIYNYKIDKKQLMEILELDNE